VIVTQPTEDLITKVPRNEADFEVNSKVDGTALANPDIFAPVVQLTSDTASDIVTVP
jgi:hypothetical protein